MKILIYILLSAVLASCSTVGQTPHITPTYPVKLDTTKLFDEARQREVPIAIYKPETDKKIDRQKVILFSHGYGQNKGGDNLAYSYLTEYLASKGYFVVSIQHELSKDSLIPVTGIVQIVRRPFWERGADNIFFVIN